MKTIFHCLIYTFITYTLTATDACAYEPYAHLNLSMGKTGDFHNYGGGVHLGYRINPSLSTPSHSSFELDIQYLDGNQSRSSMLKSEIDGEKAPIENRLKVQLIQVPIFFNYKYNALIANSNLSWYAGAGLGMGLIKSKVIQSTSFKDLTGSDTDSHTTAFLMGQLFGGLSYALTDALSIQAGAKIMNMKKMVFRMGNQSLSTKSFQTAVELGLTYSW